MPVPRVDDLLGRALGNRYRVRAWLGAGASASVYLAEDERLDRHVALKVLHPALASDAAFLKRFQSEARAAARLRHPHIVQVYDWGEDPAGVYVVLEYLAGGSLRQLLDSGASLTPEQVTAVGVQAAEGLAHAHSRGTAHRDIKPANLLFDDDGRLAIADFGIARAMADATWTEPAGVILGTARYSSPEQANGLTTGPATDVYSLALVLVEALTGTVPFSADTTIATLMARQNRRVEATPELGALGPVISDATTPDPSSRPGADWLAAQLGSVAADLPAPAPLPLAPPEAAAEAGAPGPPGTHRDTTAVGRPVLEHRDATTILGQTQAEEDIPWPLPARREAAAAGAAALAVEADPATPDRGGATDRRREPARRRLLEVGLVVLALILAAALYWLFGIYQIQVPRRPVPGVTDQTLSKAEGILSADRLGYRVAAAVYSETVASGEVVSQSPAGGQIKQGATVVLTPSKGPAPRTVPDLNGLSQGEADSRLDAAGFAVRHTKAYSETVAAGTVVSWTPTGSQPKGALISVTVSQGPQPRTVPAVAGDTYAQAQAALSAIQLNAVESQVYNNTYPAGQVVGTTPAAGQSAARGSTVTVQVSKGPQQTQVPDVTGDTVAQATSVIEAAGLTVNNVYGPPNRRVFVTDPQAGSTVNTGTGVDLYTG